MPTEFKIPMGVMIIISVDSFPLIENKKKWFMLQHERSKLEFFFKKKPSRSGELIDFFISLLRESVQALSGNPLKWLRDLV